MVLAFLAAGGSVAAQPRHPGDWDADLRYGYIDTRGRFDAARPFSEGLAAVRLDRQWGFVNRKGDMVIAASYEDVGDFSEGLAAFRQGSVSGFINRHGQVQIPAVYGPQAGRFSEGVAHVTLKDQVMFIDHTGKIAAVTSANGASDFSEGLAAVYADGYAFIDHDGVRIGTAVFAYAADFREGLAAVYVDGKWGYIDRFGRFAIAPRFADFAVYDAEKGFYEGLAVFAIKRPTRSSHGQKYVRR